VSEIRILRIGGGLCSLSTSSLLYLHRHLQHYYINLQLTQIYEQHYANHNDVKFLYMWSLVVRCGPLWSVVVISHTGARPRSRRRSHEQDKTKTMKTLSRDVSRPRYYSGQ